MRVCVKVRNDCLVGCNATRSEAHNDSVDKNGGEVLKESSVVEKVASLQHNSVREGGREGRRGGGREGREEEVFREGGRTEEGKEGGRKEGGREGWIEGREGRRERRRRDGGREDGTGEAKRRGRWLTGGGGRGRRDWE